MNLSPREFEIITLMSHGLQNKEIAGILKSSPRTIETHNRRIYRKMKVHNRANAVAIFMRRAMILK